MHDLALTVTMRRQERRNSIDALFTPFNMYTTQSKPFKGQIRITYLYLGLHYSVDFVRSYFFTNATLTSCSLFFILSSLLGGCNSKATANPPKSADRMKKSGQLVRVAFVKK